MVGHVGECESTTEFRAKAFRLDRRARKGWLSARHPQPTSKGTSARLASGDGTAGLATLCRLPAEGISALSCGSSARQTGLRVGH